MTIYTHPFLMHHPSRWLRRGVRTWEFVTWSRFQRPDDLRPFIFSFHGTWRAARRAAEARYGIRACIAVLA